MAISHFARKLLDGQTIELFGDGKTSRDYTYVHDIVSGVTAAIASAKGFEIINLGNSSPVALIDLVHSLEKVTNREAKIVWSPVQPGDVEKTWAATEKANRLLHYSPATPLRDGLSVFVQWLQDHAG